VAGTWTVSAVSSTPIDTNCIVQSMKLVSPPSGALASSPIGYDPVSRLPISGTFCLCTTVGGKLTQWYNYDCWSNSMPTGIMVPITPQPPPAVKLADLVCTSCPPGFQMQIVTV
jgi:hypothetical protein